MPNRSNSTDKGKSLRPGSSTDDARAVGGAGDFGVAESDVVERNYTSENTKRADRGGMPARAGSQGRTSGVGGNESGAGSSSGGDLDTDIIGLGTGGGVAASGKIHEPPGPDDATAPGRKSATGRGPKQGPSGSTSRRGSTVQRADDNTVAPQGADAAPSAEGESDAFASEVSSDEASGQNDTGN